MDIDSILTAMIEKQGSDLHLKEKCPPIFRISGELVRIGENLLSSEEITTMLYRIMNQRQAQAFGEELEIDFSYALQERARFRVNAFHQKGAVGAVFRLIPTKIPTIESLQLPPILKNICVKKQGLILVTGPTGSGKSTTLAAMIDHINTYRACHIITIEDPIEFVYVDKKGIINQREIGTDTLGFKQALRRALRQDPDVILIGEMRDTETISIAVTAAETGHLVFSTLHTNDATQTIDRVIDSFQPEQQGQIRLQLAQALIAVISQRLIPKADGKGRVAAIEIMLNSPTIKKHIEDNTTAKIPRIIEESASFYNMQSFNQALFELCNKGLITQEEALAVSASPNDLKIKFQSQTFVKQQ